MVSRPLVFSLAVYGAPFSAQASQTAYAFAKALIDVGHRLERVFFYQDGIHAANVLAVPPQDEENLTEAWHSLAREHQVELVVCIAAALRRGLLNGEEAQRYGKPASNLAPGFEIAGLGQLLEAAVTSDRLITFGA
ncbi:sulfurtransferase complex subunit TusD [Marinimicrobium sp. ABcell2]|uniref:sulfurtransferase complex subunit TusD n=1 Tax=Marinimicrobium sp. ABcell2 TaxID=3069751 RepID=UPI0027AEAD66|nr:sulfurtransferase complex subunit TusD [Marinimicrobium sp. ABcell2]MDQ2075665.1 sulfurtransferase complex subunit TusD [Marinimicrobium sp. ABcell2]